MIRRSNPVHVRFLLLPLPAWLLAVGLALLSWLGSAARAAEKGNVMVDKVEYHGWKNNLCLSNGEAELIITLDVGPRIISYRLVGGKNVFKNYEDQLGKTGEKEWQIRGGHRLWEGPEEMNRNYDTDKGPEAKKPHPWPPHNARSPKDYAANQLMSIWPFFDFKDARWSFGSKYITLRQDANKGPTKIGLTHQLGWVGYLNGGVLFVKRFGYDEGKTYPDQGVNFETFTNEDMLEIESLGPLIKLAPGATVEHKETWELFKGVEAVKNEEEIDKNVKAKVAEN